MGNSRKEGILQVVDYKMKTMTTASEKNAFPSPPLLKHRREHEQKISHKRDDGCWTLRRNFRKAFRLPCNERALVLWWQQAYFLVTLCFLCTASLGMCRGTIKNDKPTVEVGAEPENYAARTTTSFPARPVSVRLSISEAKRPQGSCKLQPEQL